MARDDVRVEAADAGDGDRAFRNLPYRLYSGDPNWVAPLRSHEAKRFRPEGNASLPGRFLRRFVARRGGRVVGRIAAAVDPRFADRWEPQSGFFGFFECEEDQPAARALIRAVEASLQDRGVTRVLGPVALTTNDEVGFLVEGFDSPPMVLSPYNPPWYPGLVEACGYRPRLTYHAHLWRPETTPRGFASDTSTEPALVTTRPVDLRAWASENELILDLYNRSFDRLWGFVPMSKEEWADRADALRPFVEPELIRVALHQGTPIGFSLTLLDVNVALKPLHGRLTPWGMARAWLSGRRARSARLILLGVLPEHTRRNVAHVLARDSVAAALRLGLTHAELSLVQETNEPIRRLMASTGATRCKTYRLYEKLL